MIDREQVQNFVGIHLTNSSEMSSADAKSSMLQEFGHFNPIVPELIKYGIRFSPKHRS